MVDLDVHRHVAVREPLDEVRFPRRTREVDRTRMQPRNENAELALIARAAAAPSAGRGTSDRSSGRESSAAADAARSSGEQASNSTALRHVAVESSSRIWAVSSSEVPDEGLNCRNPATCSIVSCDSTVRNSMSRGDSRLPATNLTLNGVQISGLTSGQTPMPTGAPVSNVDSS